MDKFIVFFGSVGIFLLAVVNIFLFALDYLPALLGKEKWHHADRFSAWVEKRAKMH